MPRKINPGIPVYLSTPHEFRVICAYPYLAQINGVCWKGQVHQVFLVALCAQGFTAKSNSDSFRGVLCPISLIVCNNQSAAFMCEAQINGFPQPSGASRDNSCLARKKFTYLLLLIPAWLPEKPALPPLSIPFHFSIWRTPQGVIFPRQVHW